jgi:hypothetical protein
MLLLVLQCKTLCILSKLRLDPYRPYGNLDINIINTIRLEYSAFICVNPIILTAFIDSFYNLPKRHFLNPS